MASPNSEILEFWSSDAWVDIWSGLPLKVPPLGSAAGLVRNALMPGSSVNFPQITEICERIVEEPSEARDAIDLLTNSLSDTYASFQKKLKALTICNEMMYDDSLVIMFGSAERLRDALMVLRTARDTGLGAPIDENIRMLATEVDKVVFPADGEQKRIRRISESVKSNLGKAAGMLRRDSSDRAGATAALPQAAPPHAPFQTSAPTQMSSPPPVHVAAPPPNPLPAVAPAPVALPVSPPPQVGPPLSGTVSATEASPAQAAPVEATPMPQEATAPPAPWEAAAPAPWDAAPAPWESAASEQAGDPFWSPTAAAVSKSAEEPPSAAAALAAPPPVAASAASAMAGMLSAPAPVATLPPAAPPLAPASAMPAVAAPKVAPGASAAPTAAASGLGPPAPGPQAPGPPAPGPPAPGAAAPALPFEFPTPPAFLTAGLASGPAGPPVAASTTLPSFSFPEPPAFLAAAAALPPTPASGVGPPVTNGGHGTFPLPSGPAPWDVPNLPPTPVTGGAGGGGLEAMF